MMSKLLGGSFFYRSARRFYSRLFYNPRDANYDSGPSYYVVPEIPSESYLSNKFLQPTSLPCFENAKVEEVFGAFSRMLMDCQLSLSKLSEKIKNKEIKNATEDILLSLEEICYPVDHAFQALQNMVVLKNDPIWTVLVSRLHQKLKAVRRDYLYLDPEIYNSLFLLHASQSKKMEHIEGLLNILLNDCWVNGAELAVAASGLKSDSRYRSSQKSQRNLEQLRNIQARLDQEEAQFQSMVLASSSFLHQSDLSFLSGHRHIPIAESDLAPSAPEWLPYVLGGVQNGGHISGMQVNVASDVVVRHVLKHCSTRQVRQLVWYSWVQRASIDSFGNSSHHQIANNSRIQLIRRLRNELAKNLGCPDWLSVVWHSKYKHSPSSPEALVNDVLEPLRNRLEDAGKNELKLLSVWASSNLDLHGTKLEPWDIEYAIQQYNYAASYHEHQSIVTPPEGSLTSYVQKLCTELAQLFSLNVKPQNSTSINLARSENDSIVLGIEDADDGTYLGEIILDLFQKPNQQFISGEPVPVIHSTKTHLAKSGVHFRPEIGKSSTISIVGSFSRSAETEGIQYADLISIISCFGTCLQHVASRVLHHYISGLSSNMAMDSRFLAGDLCSSIAMDGGLSLLPNPVNKKTTDHYTKHTPIGVRPPLKQISVLPFLRKLYEARFDLELWSAAESNNSWVNLNNRIWTSHLPYPMHRNDSWITSCAELFGPNSYSGLLYYHVWRSVIHHDSLAALKEAGWQTHGLDSAETSKVLRSFKDTYLANGAAFPPAELFRRFRGRDPKIDPLLLSMGCLDHDTNPSVADCSVSTAFVR